MEDFTLGAWNPSLDTLPNMFDTALGFGVQQVPQAPNTLYTVPTNALQSMSPVSDAGAQSWAGFWQDLTKGVIGYAVQRDAALNGIGQPGQAVPQTQPGAVAIPRAQQAGINPLLLLLIGGAFLAFKS